MTSDISIGNKQIERLPAVTGGKVAAVSEAVEEVKAEKPKDTPAMVERKQNDKRASVTITAEHIQASLDAAVEELNKLSINSGRGLQFKADTKLGRHIITVTNTNTGEVVRTIPTEVAILAARGGADLKGLLHDKAI